MGRGEPGCKGAVARKGLEDPGVFSVPCQGGERAERLTPGHWPWPPGEGRRLGGGREALCCCPRLTSIGELRQAPGAAPHTAGAPDRQDELGCGMCGFMAWEVAPALQYGSPCTAASRSAPPTTTTCVDLEGHNGCPAQK